MVVPVVHYTGEKWVVGGAELSARVRLPPRRAALFGKPRRTRSTFNHWASSDVRKEDIIRRIVVCGTVSYIGVRIRYV